MTPEEKAEELYNKFYLAKDAKEYTLIAVDEIIASIPADQHWFEIKNNYWQQVKQEIEKL